jgi:hypothetical protein
VDGVAVVSSAALASDRDQFDAQSDVDLVVWLRLGLEGDGWWCASARAVRDRLQDRAPAWLPDFTFFVPVPWGRLELDVHQRVLEYDDHPRTVWEEGLREALARGPDLVFDRAGRVGRMIAERTGYDERERRRRLARLAVRLDWDAVVTPEREAGRGDVAGAHYLVNGAIDELVEILFVAARQHLPGRKRRLWALAHLGLATEERLRTLRSALACDPTSTADLRRRLRCLGELWAAVREELAPELGEDVHGRFAARVSANRQLRATTVADEVEALLGRALDWRSRSAVNLLLPGSPAEVAALADDAVADLPVQLREAALDLRRALRDCPQLRTSGR